MSLSHGVKTLRDNLVFEYDLSNDKSWKGCPTTNLINGQNAVQQSSYESYVQTTSGTWLDKHSDAIRAYNDGGGQITGYVNTGVTDYTNKYHAIWTYDGELRKPVVTMRDYDASWKAKSFGTGQTMNGIGLGYGDTYTISWLQKVTNLSKRLRVGVYGRNTSSTNGFHDGLKGAYNTKLNTWERVYTTYTVSTVWNLNTSLNIYMYGHYDTRATIQVADVQWEVGSVPTKFSPGNTRSATQALEDTSGFGNALTLPSNVIKNADGSFSHNSAFSGINTGLFSGRNTAAEPFTVEAWVKSTATSAARMWIDVQGNGSSQRFYSSLLHPQAGNPLGIQGSGWSTSVPYDAEWHHQVIVMDGSTARGYADGVLVHQRPYTAYTLPADIMIGGRSGYGWSGDIALVRIYEVDLTPEEVKQNYEATKGRFQ